MASIFRHILLFAMQVPTMFVTSLWLYFLLLPIKYVLPIFFGEFGITQERAWWIYLTGIAVLVVLGQIYHYRWYIKANIIEMKCDKCGSRVKATNNFEPSKLSLEVDSFWGWHMLQSMFQGQLYRPRLRYTCTNCGHEEYICPYCHQPIGKDDKKCPHCKKRIYWIAHGFKIA